jgi:hypothetical protein
VKAGEARGPLISAAQGRQVTLAAAAGELGEAWMAADDEARRTRGEGMLRLREMNLVIHAASEADAGRARAVAAQFVREHSGRVIVLAPPAPAISTPDEAPRGAPGQEPGGGPAFISTSCFIDQQSGRQVCSELVIIGATGEEGRAARAVVFGLLVPDLPVIGWWSGGFSPLDADLLWLAELSDQLVVDSEWADDSVQDPGPGADSGAAIRALAAVLRADLGSQVRDLAWMRVTSWRALTAEIFDGADRRRLIPHISRLRVEHQGALAQALLYSAWFGSRLGLGVAGDWWQEGTSRCVVLRRGPGLGGAGGTPGSMVVELRPLERGGGQALGLAGVSVYVESAASKTSPAAPAVSMRRRPHSDVCIACAAEGEEEVTVKTVEMTPDEDWRLLSQIFDTPRPDAVFAESARLAATLG